MPWLRFAVHFISISRWLCSEPQSYVLTAHHNCEVANGGYVLCCWRLFVSTTPCQGSEAHPHFPDPFVYGDQWNKWIRLAVYLLQRSAAQRVSCPRTVTFEPHVRETTTILDFGAKKERLADLGKAVRRRIRISTSFNSLILQFILSPIYPFSLSW